MPQLRRNVEEKNGKLHEKKKLDPALRTTLPRLERALTTLRDEVKTKASIDEVKTLVKSATKRPTALLPSDDNIKEKVLIGYLSPKCDTAFYFLINVRLTEGGALKFFKFGPKSLQRDMEAV